MMHNPRLVRPLTAIAMIGLMMILTGCGAGYYTSTVNGVKKVYRTDEQGSTTLVYEVDKEGTTTVYDEQDPMYQQHEAAQKMAEAAKQAQVERIERIKHAPKRNPSDPIYVALSSVEIDQKLRQAEHTEGAIARQVRNEFESDRIIKVVNLKEEKRKTIMQFRNALAGLAAHHRPDADVDVATRASLKEIHGINRKTGKPGKILAVVFEATITSNYLPAEYTVTESGNIFRNIEVTKRFADQVKHVIKEKIGPTIPADRSAY